MSLSHSHIFLTDGTTVAAITGAGALLIDGSATTQPITGTVTANQGTSPWTIAGTVIANQGTTPWAIDGTVAATQSGAWTTGRTWALSSGTDSISAVQSGTWTVQQGTPPWSVSQSGAWTTGRTWMLSDSTDSIASVQSGTWTTGRTWTLTGATDTVTVVQPTGTSLHAVVDSGSITVDNAAGAAAVNIQDGGNTITVDGTVTANQGTANTVANGWPVKITDGVDTMGVNADGSTVVQSLIDFQVGQGQVFSLVGSFTAASGGVDNPIFLLRNPNGSGKTMKLRRLMVGCSVTNVLVVFKVFYAPTITTNGTARTPQNNLIGNGTASVILAGSLPTLASNGTEIFNCTVGQNSTESELNLFLDVPANQNIAITAAPSSNNRAVQITAIWAEV